MPFTPTEFYIADVVDARPQTKAVAYLLPTSAVPLTATTKPQALDFAGGTAPAVERYLKASLPQNIKHRPVVMTLKEYKLTETTDGKGKIDGKADIAVAFAVRRQGKLLHLFDYKSGVSYKRAGHQQVQIEPILRRTLASSLTYLHQWMEKELPHNENLAREIKVTYQNYTRQTDDDTLFYDPKRPLAWSDFQGGSRISGSGLESMMG